MKNKARRHGRGGDESIYGRESHTTTGKSEGTVGKENARQLDKVFTHPMDDDRHVQLSTNQAINAHPARLMPPEPAGWGQSLEHSSVLQPT